MAKARREGTPDPGFHLPGDGGIPTGGTKISGWFDLTAYFLACREREARLYYGRAGAMDLVRYGLIDSAISFAGGGSGFVFIRKDEVGHFLDIPTADGRAIDRCAGTLPRGVR